MHLAVVFFDILMLNGHSLVFGMSLCFLGLTSADKLFESDSYAKRRTALESTIVPIQGYVSLSNSSASSILAD